MSGQLAHSPARILQQTLINKGAGTLPTANGAWPVHNSYEPDKPDNCITVFNTQGTDDGRAMYDGERQEHHGFQVRIRGTNEEVAFAKARAIAVLLDSSLYQYTVTIDGTGYFIHSVSRSGDVLSLGKELGSSKRHLFTVNAVAALEQS